MKIVPTHHEVHDKYGSAHNLPWEVQCSEAYQKMTWTTLCDHPNVRAQIKPINKEATLMCQFIMWELDLHVACELGKSHDGVYTPWRFNGYRSKWVLTSNSIRAIAVKAGDRVPVYGAEHSMMAVVRSVEDGRGQLNLYLRRREDLEHDPLIHDEYDAKWLKVGSVTLTWDQSVKPSGKQGDVAQGILHEYRHPIKIEVLDA